LAFLLSKDGASRQNIAKNFKGVYKIRSDYVHHRTSRNDEFELEIFAQNVWRVIKILILNLGHFETKDDFINEIEKMRYGA